MTLTPCRPATSPTRPPCPGHPNPRTPLTPPERLALDAHLEANPYDLPTVRRVLEIVGLTLKQAENPFGMVEA